MVPKKKGLHLSEQPPTLLDVYENLYLMMVI